MTPIWAGSTPFIRNRVTTFSTACASARFRYDVLLPLSSSAPSDTRNIMGVVGPGGVGWGGGAAVFACDVATALRSARLDGTIQCMQACLNMSRHSHAHRVPVACGQGVSHPATGSQPRAACGVPRRLRSAACPRSRCWRGRGTGRGACGTAPGDARGWGGREGGDEAHGVAEGEGHVHTARMLPAAEGKSASLRAHVQ